MANNARDMANDLLRGLAAHNKTQAGLLLLQDDLDSLEKSVDRLTSRVAELEAENSLLDAALTEACMWYQEQLEDRGEYTCPFDADPDDFEACLTQDRPCVAMQITECWKEHFKRIHRRGNE